MSPSPSTAANGEVPLHELDRMRAGVRILALRALSSREAAEDVVQETTSRLLAALRRGSRPDNLAAFAVGIARHVITDVIRRRSRDALDVETLPTPAPADDPLTELISDEERARLRSALSEVPPADREILHLAYFEGLRSREIAARLGEPGERIRKRKQRAVERLRAAFLAAPGHEARAPSTILQERG